jgi:hypothetical protein
MRSMNMPCQCIFLAVTFMFIYTYMNPPPSLLTSPVTINLSIAHRRNKVYTVHIHSYEYKNGRFAKGVMHNFENGGHQDKKIVLQREEVNL